MTSLKRIAILTGGGDCPGLNAVIRAVAKTAQNDYGVEVIGALDSYWGLVTENFRVLTNQDVSGILGIGGTILGTSRVNPFAEAHKDGLLPSPEENWDVVKAIFEKHGIDGLVVVGGDGSLRVAARAFKAGVPVVGVPKTIDNDIGETDITFGFNSAVSIIMNALDVLHTTAMSHHRVMVVEVMGRTVGWLGLYGGVAGGGDILLLPEIPFRMEPILERVAERSRTGKKFSIIVVSEGASPQGEDPHFSSETDASGRKVLGGIGKRVADLIQEKTDISTRVTTLGHLQRGGPPTAFDRVLATEFGHAVMRLAADGEWGKLVVSRGGNMESASLDVATRKPKAVPLDHPLIEAGRSVGTYFGDED